MTFLQAAPLLGYTSVGMPSPLFNDTGINDLLLVDMRSGLQPGESESPLYVNLQHAAQYLTSKPDTKCPPAIQEIIVNAWRSQSFYRPDISLTSCSLLKSVLQRIDAMMSHVRADWCGGKFWGEGM